MNIIIKMNFITIHLTIRRKGNKNLSECKKMLKYLEDIELFCIFATK